MKRMLWSLIVCLLAGAGPAFSQEPMQTLLGGREKNFVLVFGGTSVRFDSSFKYLDNETGESIFIDPEGHLGLADRQEVPTLSMLVSLGDRHYISIGATRFRRDANFISVEGTGFGNLDIHSGSVDTWLDSNDFDLSYGYRLFADEHIRILGKLGLYTLDLDSGIHVEGEWSIDGDPPQSGVYLRERSLVAPLPLLGVLFDFYINRRWALATSVDAMYLPIGDITGRALRTRINVRYAFGSAVGVTFGINYFDIHVTDQNDERKYDIKYGYDGLFAGLIFAF